MIAPIYIKTVYTSLDEFVNEASQDTESIKVVTTEKSCKTLTSELDNNHISYTHDKDNKYTLIFDNSLHF